LGFAAKHHFARPSSSVAKIWKSLIPTGYCCCKEGIRVYAIYKVINFASHSASSGDGPEVYAEMLTKNLTPYVTTQVCCQDISG